MEKVNDAHFGCHPHYCGKAQAGKERAGHWRMAVRGRNGTGRKRMAWSHRLNYAPRGRWQRGPGRPNQPR